MLMIKCDWWPHEGPETTFFLLCFNLSRCQLQENVEQVFPKDPCDCPHSLPRSTWAQDYPKYEEDCIGLRPRQFSHSSNGTTAGTSECPAMFIHPLTGPISPPSKPSVRFTYLSLISSQRLFSKLLSSPHTWWPSRLPLSLPHTACPS